MKKATGDVKRLLIVLGDIQTLAGRAKSAYQNDRDICRADHVVPPLEEIFNKCVEERGRFEPLVR